MERRVVERQRIGRTWCMSNYNGIGRGLGGEIVVKLRKCRGNGRNEWKIYTKWTYFCEEWSGEIKGGCRRMGK